MRKFALNKVLPVFFGLALLAMTIFAISSCGGYYFQNCEVTCPDVDYPYWGGDNWCYATKAECETYYDTCWDCYE